ncbi:glycoside hydrolase 5 family protein [Asticcacaulis machinosus]|uniref:mannan endo-1,4-beta-mannosidase n=1 Tax=Asticcacaulis machinosus TaxID=2984211 RepID=A0ABT5HH95_9CAUL|nr:cellulase family glycosylhydrolase [Asticcacaulis machinosus]MDC7675573.1 cellulase family glycosylhydrolase [Asticcacaulis machinosus]
MNRRHVLGLGTGLIATGAGCATMPPVAASFVTTADSQFRLAEETYRFVGANIWYGAYLGSPGPTGNRARLMTELDDMKALGITNLRVLASSELSPLTNSLDPAFSNRTPGDYNEDLLVGLDFLLAEMAKRDMKAVLYLTNFWEWSGGMMAYLEYTTGAYINNGDPAHPWPAFADYTSKFYSNGTAVQLYHHYIRTLLSRTNTVTGRRHVDDPTIMAWQLSNEPRAGGGVEISVQNMPVYLKWISDTAALIRSLDPNHLVSLGHEGLMGAVGNEQFVIDAHKDVDYLTAHIWPQNWGWVDGKNLATTFDSGEKTVAKYIADHIEIAKKIGKPLVFEEFGFPRDEGAFLPGTPTVWKDKFYGMIYAAVEDAIKSGSPVMGSNFWAWGGAGRAQHADYWLQKGETAYVGDPPHEPQGWYSVFNTDTSTQALIRRHADALKTV